MVESTAAREFLESKLFLMIRPLFIIIVALLFYNITSVIYKLKLSLQALSYLLFCNDKAWKKPADPFSIFESAIKTGKVEKKTIVFIRHGESTWNETFNKGSHRSLVVFIIGYIPNMIKAILYECYLIVTGKIDR